MALCVLSLTASCSHGSIPEGEGARSRKEMCACDSSGRYASNLVLNSNRCFELVGVVDEQMQRHSSKL